MNKPILVIMAAGMGSRFGGLKQIEPVSEAGEIILDFSLYDAVMAGFQKVIFIIKRENEEAFRELIDGRAGKYIDVEHFRSWMISLQVTLYLMAEKSHGERPMRFLPPDTWQTVLSP